MIACPSVFGAWTGHNEFSRALAEDVTIALDATYPKREAAAADMDLHPADLSRQLSGRDPLNLWRLAALGWPFWIAFCVARMARVGGVVLTADQLTFIKGAAALGPRMLSAILPTEDRKRA
jgi:hypothetical protein